MRQFISLSPVKIALLLALSLCVGACAVLPHARPMVRISAVKPRAAEQFTPEDGYYFDAAAAINRRDYVRALELLQNAQRRKADDVRVLNAFAVVYDKLGRFDLSARYYELARNVDPTSTVVKHNLEYSLLLQGKTPDGAIAMPTALAMAPTPRATEAPAPRTTGATAPSATEAMNDHPGGGRVVRVNSGVVRLLLPTQMAQADGAPRQSDHVITLVNATGRTDGVIRLGGGLNDLGWSTPQALARNSTKRKTTLIRYPQARLAEARSLAHTLHAPVRMAVCNDGCLDIRLIVGADSRQWASAISNRVNARHPADS